MSIFILLDSKTNSYWLFTAGPWPETKRQAARPSAGSGGTAQLINLLRVCPLVADMGIAGLSWCRSLFKESEAWLHLGSSAS